MLGKPRAHSERTFAHKSAHLRKRAHISKVPTSTFVCHNSARAENCKTYTFHDHEHKFKRAEKSVLWKIQANFRWPLSSPFPQTTEDEPIISRWFKPWPFYSLVEGHQQPFQKVTQPTWNTFRVEGGWHQLPNSKIFVGLFVFKYQNIVTYNIPLSQALLTNSFLFAKWDWDMLWILIYQFPGGYFLWIWHRFPPSEQPEKRTLHRSGCSSPCSAERATSYPATHAIRAVSEQLIRETFHIPIINPQIWYLLCIFLGRPLINDIYIFWLHRGKGFL